MPREALDSFSALIFVREDVKVAVNYPVKQRSIFDQSNALDQVARIRYLRKRLVEAVSSEAQ